MLVKVHLTYGDGKLGSERTISKHEQRISVRCKVPRERRAAGADYRFGASARVLALATLCEMSDNYSTVKATDVRTYVLWESASESASEMRQK